MKLYRFIFYDIVSAFVVDVTFNLNQDNEVLLTDLIFVVSRGRNIYDIYTELSMRFDKNHSKDAIST